jgi:undecaprenyl-diphosphatase
MTVGFMAFILGLIQALTEFLPVSSSAHLILARTWMDFPIADGLTFDVALHLGTLIAIIVYFWRDLVALARGAFGLIVGRPGPAAPATVEGAPASRRMGRTAFYLVIACLPAAFVGYKYETAIETYFRHPAVIVVTLVLGALAFFWVEKKFRHDRPMDSLTLGRALLIGCAQTLALVPGISRSGSTIVAGMMCGLRRDEAARFSFLLATPITFGAVLKKSMDLFGSGTAIPHDEKIALIVGILTSGIGGWLVIRFLLNFLRQHSLNVFAWYRIALAGVVALFLLR